MFATVDTNRKIGIPMRLMSTIAYERKPPLYCEPQTSWKRLSKGK